jgi:D-alanyl-D-alanine carboxypeptidase (penicillin-binding protein 5/6)
LIQPDLATKEGSKLVNFKHFLFVLGQSFLSLFLISSASAFSPEEDLSARSAFLVDARTGKVLFQKDPDLRLPPASTTKIVTALVTLESGRKLHDILTVSKTATRVPASKLYLRPGQTISIEHLLYSVMLSSANDASMVLAEGIGGSVEQFAESMTTKAHQLGAINTHFTNPHGLTAADHYSTARDLATIFRYAMKNDIFQQIIHTKISSVKSTSPGKKRRQARLMSVRNHNRLLWNFDGALGGKTGYTLAAQKCFVGAVERNGVMLIVSLLGSRDLWSDTKRLLEYGFDNYEMLKASTQTSARASSRGSLRMERISGSVVTPNEEERVKFTDRYVLQVGSFRERERAESLLNQFSQRGFEAFLENIALKSGGTAYRVRIGPYTLLLEAQETAAQILNQIGQQAMIVRLSFPDIKESGS